MKNTVTGKEEDTLKCPGCKGTDLNYIILAAVPGYNQQLTFICNTCGILFVRPKNQEEKEDKLK